MDIWWDLSNKSEPETSAKIVVTWRGKWQPTSVFLPGEYPWTEEPGGLQSPGSQRVGHDWTPTHSTQTWFPTTEPVICAFVLPRLSCNDFVMTSSQLEYYMITEVSLLWLQVIHVCTEHYIFQRLSSHCYLGAVWVDNHFPPLPVASKNLSPCPENSSELNSLACMRTPQNPTTSAHEAWWQYAGIF